MAFTEEVKLCHEFDLQRGQFLSGRVSEVASKQQFTGIADTDHRRIGVHETVSSDAFMEGLACGGVKHMFLETIDPVGENVFQSYREGKISDQDLQIIGQTFFASTAEQDFDVDPQRSRQTMIDYMVNAKKYGIDLHNINRGEGIFTDEEYDDYQELGQQISTIIVDVAENDPTFKTIDSENKASYLISAMGSKLSDQERLDLLERHQGIIQSRQERYREAIDSYQAEGFSLQDAQKKVVQDIVQTRLEKDGDVAQRAKEIVGDDKAAIVWGLGHFNRRFGDMDAHLNLSYEENPFIQAVYGNITTIAIYEDRQVQDNVSPPSSTSGLDWFKNQHMDYHLDANTMTWQKQGGVPVQLQELQQTPVLQENLRPDIPVSQPVAF